MNEKVMNLLREKPLIIPKILFKNYKKMNITEEEFIVLIFLLNLGDKIIYNPEFFSSELNINKYKVMEIINNLFEKKVISIIVEKNIGNKTEEYITFDMLYSKLMNDVIECEENVKIETDVFSTFENEMGRPISPMEYDMIKQWVSDYKKELVIEALKEAVYNGVSNFRYIDKILYEWKKKGINSLDMLLKEKNLYNKRKEQVDYFEYNWLEDE